MNLIYNVPLISLLIVIISSIFVMLIKSNKIALIISLLGIFSVGILSFFLLIALKQHGYIIYRLGHFSAPYGSEIRFSGFEAIMAFSFSLVMFLSILGNIRSFTNDINEKKLRYYYIMLNLILCSILALIYTNDIFTAYIFIELNTIAASAIIMIKDKKETIVATIKYMIMSLLGSGLILMAIAVLYSQTGQLSMPYMHDEILRLISENKDLTPLKIGAALITAGLCIKSALYPFSSWLPSAHGSATANSSAILSGIVLKGYIILLLKLYFRVFGLDLVESFGLNNVLFILGILAMIIGSLRAIQQQKIKRIIAYSSISQIGYIFMGIGLGTMESYGASAFHIIFHAATKPMLFTAAGGLLEANNHRQDLEDLRGVGRLNKIAGLGILVGALAMIGLPFFSGFISKISFAMASLGSSRSFITLSALAASTVLNAMYYVPLIIIIFSSVEDIGIHKKKKKYFADKSFYISMISFIVINLFLGTYYQPLMRIIGNGLENL